MQQWGADLQASLGEWLIKAEAVFQDTGIAGSSPRNLVLPDESIVRRDLVPDSHYAFAGGAEYTFFGLIGKSDLGVLGEYLYDSEQAPNAVAFRPFQNDLFTGVRWSRNNPGDGALLAGVTVDLERRTLLWRAEYSERYFERVVLTASIDLINAASKDPLAVFNNDDRLTVKLSYAY